MGVCPGETCAAITWPAGTFPAGACAQADDVAVAALVACGEAGFCCAAGGTDAPRGAVVVAGAVAPVLGVAEGAGVPCVAGTWPVRPKGDGKAAPVAGDCG